MLGSVRKPPLVTGISPKEGPPGTKVTIRGEDLGIDNKDLISLRICGVDCLLSAEWKSNNKIVARTGQARGRGDIIVVTRSGGVGSSTVQFKGFIIHIGPLEESAVWVDESQSAMIQQGGGVSPLADSEYDDPLGICDESNDKKYPTKDLNEMFPDASGSTAKEDFNPAWFLLENHYKTNFEDLKAGLIHLKRKSTDRNEGPLAFVKTHLSTFMDCQDTLAAMHTKLHNDQKAAVGGCITQALEDVLYKSNTSAEALFMDVLKRKDRADATRNALSVLHRFRFLFNLPCSIDRNIRRGDYDLAITDFTRAKSLFGETDVPIFKKVYREVEKRIAVFQKQLTHKLTQLPSSADEQKRLIRYLVHLEAEGDPAWTCLTHMQEWILQLLYQCCEDHLKKDRESEKAQEQKSLRRESHVSIAMSVSDSKTASKAPQKVLFVESLTRILQDNLPDFWRLGQSYLSGKLLKQTKDKPTRVSPEKGVQLKEMVLEISRVFSCLLRAAFLPTTLKHLPPTEIAKYGTWTVTPRNSPIAWLPICIRNVRQCSISLSSLELPSDSTEVLQDLAFDMRINCMNTLLTQAIKDINNLHMRETWIVDSHDEHGGTTALPSVFESIVSETVQHLQEVLVSKSKEKELFSDESIQMGVARLCAKLFTSFATTMEDLGLNGNAEQLAHAKRMSLAMGEKNVTVPDTVPKLEQRLIIVLSSCVHTVDNVMPRVLDLLDKHGYPSLDQVSKVATHSFIDLDKRLFERYLEEKANPIIGVLEQSMYSGNFDWKRVNQVTGVRRYIKEAIMGMIEVHAEVYSISPQCVTRVLTRVSQAVVDELCRLYQCAQGYNQYGAIQARLDLAAIETTIAPYKTARIIDSLQEAKACFPKISSDQDKTHLQQQVDTFQTQMAFMLTCFKKESNTLKGMS